ncbi:MAG: MinD/ParA family protein [Deltaproteobacteria bacterium]|nr:MinD/ParA family protein [Deltaproteobacteria bacterium]
MNLSSKPQKIIPRQRASTTAAAKHPRVICITSGKGGVGKTNLTANLAYTMAAAGLQVLILDADLNLANIDILLGLTPKYNLQHVFTGEKSLKDVMIKGPGGINILPGASGIMELANLDEEQRLYFLSEMAALDNKIDILLIDTGAGINENVIYFNLAAQERIILLTPEPTSLTDAYAMIKVLSTRHAVKRFKIMVNMALSAREAINVFKQLSKVCDQFLATLSLDFIGYLPYDRQLVKAVRSQCLVTEKFPNCPASNMLRKISKDLVAETPQLTDDGNIKFFWNNFLVD